MDDRFHPIPQTSGALGPPDRHPPTAVGVATPPPPPNRGRIVRATPAGPFRRAIRSALGGVRQLAASARHVVTGLLEHRTQPGHR